MSETDENSDKINNTLSISKKKKKKRRGLSESRGAEISRE